MEEMKDASRCSWRFMRPVLEGEVTSGAVTVVQELKDLTGGNILRK